jgi:hypothetical protein
MMELKVFEILAQTSSLFFFFFWGGGGGGGGVSPFYIFSACVESYALEVCKISRCGCLPSI